MMHPTIDEWHSSDLTAECPRAVMLRHLGRAKGESPTALVRGSIANHTLCHVHAQNRWWDVDFEAALDWAQKTTRLQTQHEGRTFTKAVIKGWTDIVGEVRQAAVMYVERYGERFSQCTTVGTGVEVPVRLTVGEREFASHVDLLVRDVDNVFGRGEGRLICPDWKWTQESPFGGYVARNLQAILYSLAISEGQVQIEDEWIHLGQWPAIAQIWLPGLLPFKRKTMSKDDAGELREFVKGDVRPDRCSLHWANFKTERRDDMAEALVDRVRMQEAGFWPAIPGPVRCHTCDSGEWCDRYDMADLERKEQSE